MLSLKGLACGDFKLTSRDSRCDFATFKPTGCVL